MLILLKFGEAAAHEFLLCLIFHLTSFVLGDKKDVLFEIYYTIAIFMLR